MTWHNISFALHKPFQLFFTLHVSYCDRKNYCNVFRDPDIYRGTGDTSEANGTLEVVEG